jgi:predicted amidohydrolase
MRAPLTVAAVQPRCRPKDVRANALEHAAAIRRSEARVVVFPELSLTGYELDADAVSPDDEALQPIVAACTETGAVAFVGAPVNGEGGAVHIGTLEVSADGAEVAYRKTYLGADEAKRFSPGGGAVARDVDGWRIGIGICKDTGVEQHVADTGALHIDLYVAGLVHLPEELGMQEERAQRLALACDAAVAFASFAGSTGGGYDRTAGVSSIWSPAGEAIARAGSAPGGIARARLRGA